MEKLPGMPPSNPEVSTKRPVSKRGDIQGIRGWAIALVTLFHFLPQHFPNGYIGVDMFFVLSRYLIAMILQRCDQLDFDSFGMFYYRRVKRVVPLYLLASLYTFFPPTLILINQTSTAVSSLASMPPSFLQNLCALYAFPTTKLLSAMCFIACGSSFAAPSHLSEEGKGGEIDGESVTYTLLEEEEGLEWIWWCGSGIVIAILLMGFTWIPIEHTWLRLCITLLTALLICLGEFSKSSLLTNRVMNYLGDISYALYLFHWPVYVYVNIHKKTWEAIHPYFLGISASIVIAVFLYHAFETKYLKLEKGYIFAMVTILYAVCIVLLVGRNSIVEMKELGRTKLDEEIEDVIRFNYEKGLRDMKKNYYHFICQYTPLKLEGMPKERHHPPRAVCHADTYLDSRCISDRANMSDAVSKAEKLALARKKLKEFESRRQRDADGASSSLSQASDVLNGRQSTVSQHSALNHECEGNGVHEGHAHSAPPVEHLQPGSLPASVHSGGHSPHPATGAGSQASLWDVERGVLLRERDQAAAAYAQCKQQLADLHGHYSQLHSAYSQLSAGGAHDGTQQQVVQLQGALSVVVAERAELQARLREMSEQLDREKEGREGHKVSSAEEAARGEAAAAEVRRLQTILEEKTRLVDKRSDELSSLRTESSQLQAALQTIQHDKNEAQARLRSVFRERDELESELKTARRELSMKELLLKQLGAGGAAMIHPDSIQQLHDDRDRLSMELAAAQSAAAEAVREAGEVRAHFEEVHRDMTNKMEHMHREVDELSRARSSAEQTVADLRAQVEHASAHMKRAATGGELAGGTTEGAEGAVGVTTGSVVGAVSEEECVRRVEAAVKRVNGGWETRMEQQLQAWDEERRDKDRLVMEREQQLMELQARVMGMEERERDRAQSGTDLLALADQLQNEKATVSRAVAQNRELKEQIVETENRLMAVTGEKLESELARQTAEHQVKQLLHRLETLGVQMSDSSRALSEQPAVSQQAPPTQELESATTSEDEDEVDEGHHHHHHGQEPGECDAGNRVMEDELRRQLDDSKRQLEEVRSELRRSHTQNEEMNQIMRQNAEDENQNSFHVELSQAVARIHTLAAENEQLREQMRRKEEEEQVVEQTEGEEQREEEQLRAVQLERENGVLREAVATLREEKEQAMAQLEQSRLAAATAVVEQAEQMANGGNGTVAVEEEKMEVEGEEKEQAAPPLRTAEWARAELEKRFAQAMNQIADMQEHVERVEHVNTQLQLENETIADHVVLYQHQRRLIRERLRAKDAAMACVEAERARVVEKCAELEHALRTVLARVGNQPPQPSPLQNGYGGVNGKVCVRRKKSRSYSHSTVDELSGDEERVVEASDMQIPPRSCSSLSDEADSNGIVRVESAMEEERAEREEQEERVREEERVRVRDEMTDPAVQRIMQLIEDIRTVPVSDPKMQCTQCIGELQTL